jgi:hypothetical protein
MPDESSKGQGAIKPEFSLAEQRIVEQHQHAKSGNDDRMMKERIGPPVIDSWAHKGKRKMTIAGVDYGSKVWCVVPLLLGCFVILFGFLLEEFDK